ncbi:unnamed protein product [Strongylus vulgaris]|uniref:Uncharacterized protein n=1 Tax=Strongylus vulgaris TaxID=40348 RepID=A0A3P7KY95_STRVU|nr:unnamed protein product [Strongylus vulgaris]
MSEDNLASAECGTPAYRTPSYIRVSCALSGYTKCVTSFARLTSQNDCFFSNIFAIFRSPRLLESSAARAMGRSLVERRLGLFDTSIFLKLVWIRHILGSIPSGSAYTLWILDIEVFGTKITQLLILIFINHIFFVLRRFVVQ